MGGFLRPRHGRWGKPEFHPARSASKEMELGNGFSTRPRELISMPILNRLADMHAEITEWRHDLHAHPELRYDEHRTAATVAEKLTAFGCDEVAIGIGRTGVVGVIRGRKPGTAGARHAIGLRADMDALPIEE